MKIVSEFAAAVDTDGCDVAFLNRPDLKNVKDVRALEAAMEAPPKGSTPLSKTVKRVLHDKGFALAGEPQPRGAQPAKRLLVIIATDGIPDEGAPAFVDVLQALPDGVHVQLMPCTDDDAVLAWMKEADDKVRFLDKCDDFAEEAKEVMRHQGDGFGFSHGDYLTKILLGAVDPFFDSLVRGRRGARLKRAPTTVAPRTPLTHRNSSQFTQSKQDSSSVRGQFPLPFPAFAPFNAGGRMHYRSMGGPDSPRVGGGGGGGGGK